MGSHSISTSWDGKLTPEQVRQKFSVLLADDRHENGHGGYTGSWGTMNGISFPRVDTFPTQEAAEDYCLNNTSKWDNAMAVKYKHITKTLTKQPTFNGKPRQEGYGTVAYYRDYKNGQSFLVFADQVTLVNRGKVEKLEKDYAEANRAYHIAQRDLDETIGLIKKPPKDGDHSDVLVPLPVRREAFLRAERVARENAAALKALQEKLIADLYSYSENSEVRWMIAGWAAS